MKHAFEYKGYLGSAEVDAESNVVYGKLLFLRDVISYEAATPAELKTQFESAVDDYLAQCKELGDEPDVPCKGTFNVRVAPDLHRAASIHAANCDLKLNEVVVLALQAYLWADRATVKHSHDHNHNHTVSVMVGSTSNEVHHFNVSSAQGGKHAHSH